MFFKKKTPVDLSLAGIKKFIGFTRQFSISSLSVGRKGARLTVYQNPTAQPAVSQSDAEPVFQVESYEKIKSNTVGVFIPIKGIAAGSQIKKGQIVAKIAAMKIENEILAEKDCVIQEVLVKANELIEYGQPLFFIE